MAKKTIKDDFTLLAILLIPIAIAINFICGNLALALKLPLYLDSIGTYLVGMLAGPWVALVTGFLSITINAVSDPTLFPYALLAGLMGMVDGFFAKKGLFTSVPGMVFSGLVVALCSVGGTVVIKYIFFGGFGTSGVSILAATIIASGQPFWVGQFAAQMVGELPDKFISVLVPFLVIRGMSGRYLYKFMNGRVFIDARRRKAAKCGEVAK